MTADPTWPGDTPIRNHPGSAALVGTSAVPFGLRPSADNETERSIAGMRSSTGADRATTGLPRSFDLSVLTPATDGGVNEGSNWGATVGTTHETYRPSRKNE